VEPAIAEILLPTDLSPRSALAARYAVTMARSFNSRLTLLHVLLPLIVGRRPPGAPDHSESAFEDRKKDLRARIDSFLAEELREFEVKRVVTEGDPAQAIAEYAAGNRTDMIVMETRGTGIFRRYLLGSVTAKVLHDAPCPVFTGLHAKETDAGKEWSLRRILCAVDPGCGDEAAVRWAVKLAAAFKARLFVVHVVPAPPFNLQTYAIESELAMLLGRGERERIVKLLEAAGGPPDTEVHVSSGPVSKVVLSFAEDLQADVVVIGHGAENGIPGRLHSNGYSIIRDSICPVLSV